MEISGNYTANNIPKASDAYNGNGADKDNFADIMSNVMDNSRNTPPKPPKSSDVSDNKATASDDNAANDAQSNDVQTEAQETSSAQNDAVAADKVKDKTADDDTTKPIENAQNPKTAADALLSLILNKAPQTNNLAAANKQNNASDGTKIIDITQSTKNPALLAAQNQNLVQNDAANAAAQLPELQAQTQPNPAQINPAKTDAKTSKFDFLMAGNAQNNAETNVATATNGNTQTPATDAKTLVSLMTKGNMAQPQTQNPDGNGKTPDASQLLANSYAANDAKSATSGSDSNKSAADQNSNIRINLDNIQSLAAIMVRKSLSGDKSFTVRLDPPELGEIKVELKVDKDRKTKAIISASNQEALGDLSKSVKELTQSLKDSGIDINEDDFEFNLNNQFDGNSYSENKNSETTNQQSDTATNKVATDINNPTNGDTQTTPQRWHNLRVSLIA